MLVLRQNAFRADVVKVYMCIDDDGLLRKFQACRRLLFHVEGVHPGSACMVRWR